MRSEKLRQVRNLVSKPPKARPGLDFTKISADEAEFVMRVFQAIHDEYPRKTYSFRDPKFQSILKKNHSEGDIKKFVELIKRAYSD